MTAHATALITETAALGHDTGPGHPERPARLEAIWHGLKAIGLWPTLTVMTPRPATLAELSSLHTAEYIERLTAACRRGEPTIDCDDSRIGPASEQLARLAAGAALTAVEAVMAGQVANAFVAMRPPGHHAEADRSMGFCLYNNVALAAWYLRHVVGLPRVAIIDWDVHHGNGTQHLFETDASVLFVSLHEHPDSLYPHTGYDYERGRGPGLGATLNVAFAPGAGDDHYIAAFDRQVLPAVRTFAPQFVLVSAGYDAHHRDPLAHIQLTERGFAHMAATVKALADEVCNGRLVGVLEGGYDLTALAVNVAATVGLWAGQSTGQVSSWTAPIAAAMAQQPFASSSINRHRDGPPHCD